MTNLQRELYIPVEHLTPESKGSLKVAIEKQAQDQGVKCIVKNLGQRLSVVIDGDNELKIAAYEAALLSWRASQS